MVAAAVVAGVVFFGGVMPMVFVLAMCTCFKKRSYVPMTSSQHDDNLRVPLSKNASPVCGDLPEGRVDSPFNHASYQGSPNVSCLTLSL